MQTGSRTRSASARFFNPFGLEMRAAVLYHVLALSLSILTVDRIAAYRFAPADDSRAIVLVGSLSCPHSRAVRTRLVASGIPFREVLADRNPIDRALAAWAFQSLSVPVVVVGPKVIYGNRRDRIDVALAQLGYEIEDSTPRDPKASLAGPT